MICSWEVSHTAIATAVMMQKKRTKALYFWSKGFSNVSQTNVVGALQLQGSCRTIYSNKHVGVGHGPELLGDDLDSFLGCNAANVGSNCMGLTATISNPATVMKQS